MQSNHLNAAGSKLNRDEFSLTSNLLEPVALHYSSDFFKEIGPELKHVFVKFRLETGHLWIHRNLDEGMPRFFNVG